MQRFHEEGNARYGHALNLSRGENAEGWMGDVPIFAIGCEFECIVSGGRGRVGDGELGLQFGVFANAVGGVVEFEKFFGADNDGAILLLVGGHGGHRHGEIKK